MILLLIIRALKLMCIPEVLLLKHCLYFQESLSHQRVISPLRLSKIFIAPLEKFSALEML